MNIRPLHDRVLVKRQESAHKTASGIVIPDAASEKPDQGEIIAVGPGKMSGDGKVRLLDVKAGDKVLFGKYAGQPVKVGSDELLVGYHRRGGKLNQLVQNISGDFQCQPCVLTLVCMRRQAKGTNHG